MKSRTIPAAIRRQLRQEAYFGCVVCGNPILEYHHIVPWADLAHHNPADMVALCPLHHTEYSKRPKEHAYDAKASPINKAENTLKGKLYTERTVPEFVLGGNTFVGTPVILMYYEFPLVSYRIEDGQNLISVYFPDRIFWPEISIVDNDIIAKTGDFWDIVFSTNYILIKRKNGQLSLEIDFRPGKAHMRANFTIFDKPFSFNSDHTQIGGATMRNNTFRASKAGISIGDRKKKIIPPNYAMKNPQAVFVEL